MRYGKRRVEWCSCKYIVDKIIILKHKFEKKLYIINKIISVIYSYKLYIIIRVQFNSY